MTTKTKEDYSITSKKAKEKRAKIKNKNSEKKTCFLHITKNKHNNEKKEEI